MSDVNAELRSKFVCPKCKAHQPKVEKLALSGSGLSRMFDIQPYRYTFVPCQNCGFTEIYDTRVLEGKDDLGLFLDMMFSG